MLFMNQPVMVDSAVYIDAFRAGVDVRQQLLPYLANGLLYNCGIIRAEVLRGFKSRRLKEDMTAFFNIVPEVHMNAKFWQQAAELAWTLDRTSGGARPLTDIVIARCAMQVDAVLISPDRHFTGIPGLRLSAAL